MTAPVSPSVGWGVLHLFCRPLPLVDPAAVIAAAKASGVDDHPVVAVSLLGHKADVALMAMGPDLRRLRRFQTEVQAAGLEVVDSYVSLTELSEYSDRLPDEMKQARLYPELPPADKPAWCFYPMTKRRTPDQNWYTLDFEQRQGLMAEHGASGRKFAGRVLQLITGSTGLDDYEWGVTLFALTPDVLKEVVYTMRYDQASALYAEFGPFYTGMVDDIEAVLEESLA